MCQHTDPGMTLKHRDLIHSGRVATQGSGPVVAGGSRKIVNSDWREVDEGHLPIPYRSDGS